MKNLKGIILCFMVATSSWILGKKFEIIGGAVIAIIIGMIVSLVWKDKSNYEDGIKFTSKKVLQWAGITIVSLMLRKIMGIW